MTNCKRIIVVMLLALLSIIEVNAQSLAEKYNEQRSIWNAVAKHNGMNPTEINNRQKEEFIDNYTDSLQENGHDIKNYFYSSKNSRNNLAILHYDPRGKGYLNVNPEDHIRSNNETSTIKLVLVDTLRLPTITANPVRTIVDTVFVSIEATPVRDTIMVAQHDTVEVKDEYCNCTGLSLEEAWSKHLLLRNSYAQDRAHNNHQINSACRVKLRRYIQELRRLQKRIANDKADLERLSEDQKTLEIKKNVLYIPFVGEVNVENAKVISTQPILTSKKRKANKKRRVKKLGKGHSRGKNIGFLSVLFPFRGC